MIHNIRSLFKNFRRKEDGSATIEFVIFVPLILTFFMSSIELGIFTLRQMFLDRGLEMAVREIRLNTGASTTHNEVKDMVCAYAGFLKDCDTELKLTMKPHFISSYAGPTGLPSECSDVALAINPSQTFAHGAEHQMMLMVACYTFDPIFASTGLGYALNEQGLLEMYGMSGFIQEPS